MTIGSHTCPACRATVGVVLVELEHAGGGGACTCESFAALDRLARDLAEHRAELLMRGHLVARLSRDLQQATEALEAVARLEPQRGYNAARRIADAALAALRADRDQEAGG